MAALQSSNKRTSFNQDDNLDPRIQVELEKLNKASDDINRLELLLDEARSTFRTVLTDSTQQLNALAKKLGSCIDKARPYYESRLKAKEAQRETQNAALRYERACGQLMAAKEMVNLAEQGFFRKGQPFDPAWQEMLNHATIKVNDAEKERYESEIEHQYTASLFNEAEQTVTMLHKQLKRNINKSRPYFEQKARFNQRMEEQKKLVGELEQAVVAAKSLYAEALRNLECISDEIHQQRREAALRQEIGKRVSGVGAESPSPPPPSESSPEEDSARVPPPPLLKGRRNFSSSSSSSSSLKSLSSRESLSKSKNTTPVQKSSSVKRPLSLVTKTEEVVPKVELTTPGHGKSQTPVKELPEGPPMSPAGTETDLSVATNAEIMDSLQRAKGIQLLRPPRRASTDNLLDGEGSDSESVPGSLASLSVLDDEQVECLMQEVGDMEQLLARLDKTEKWSASPLPARLGYLEEFIRSRGSRSGSSLSSEGGPLSPRGLEGLGSPRGVEGLFAKVRKEAVVAKSQEDGAMKAEGNVALLRSVEGNGAVEENGKSFKKEEISEGNKDIENKMEDLTLLPNEEGKKEIVQKPQNESSQVSKEEIQSKDNAENQSKPVPEHQSEMQQKYKPVPEHQPEPVPENQSELKQTNKPVPELKQQPKPVQDNQSQENQIQPVWEMCKTSASPIKRVNPKVMKTESRSSSSEWDSKDELDEESSESDIDKYFVTRL